MWVSGTSLAATPGFLALLAERQRNVMVCGADLVEVEHLRIPVRCLVKIRTGVGHVIDERDIEPGWLGAGRPSRTGRGGSEGQNLDQPAAADLAGLIIMNVLCDKPFHGNSPFTV